MTNVLIVPMQRAGTPGLNAAQCATMDHWRGRPANALVADVRNLAARPENAPRPAGMVHLADRELFRRIYDECGAAASTHELTGNHMPRVSFVLDQIGPDDDVVDIGCADGLVLAEVARVTTGRLVGIDISEAHTRHNRAAHPFACTWVCADGEACPVPDDAFDVALLCEVLEHVIDPAPLLAEAERVVRPGGRVVVTTPILAMVLDHRGIAVRRALHGMEVDLHVREFDPAVELAGKPMLETSVQLFLDLDGTLHPAFYLAAYTVAQDAR